MVEHLLPNNLGLCAVRLSSDNERSTLTYALSVTGPVRLQTGTNDGPLVSPVMGLTLPTVGTKRVLPTLSSPPAARRTDRARDRATTSRR